MPPHSPRFQRTLGIAFALAVVVGACQRPAPPRDRDRSATRTPSLGSGAQAPSAVGSAPGARPPITPETVAMELPQPDLAPDAADDDASLEALPPLPPGTRLVLGSEVVASTRAPGRAGTLVNVWATWCESCAAEMPMLEGLRQRYAGRIELVFVSVDEPERAATVQAELGKRGIRGPALIARPRLGRFKRALSPIWRGSLPATFLYDHEGRLRYFWGAQAYEREVTPVLDGFLRGEPIDGMANFSVTPGASGPEPAAR